jgi:hypothetical protein
LIRLIANNPTIRGATKPSGGPDRLITWNERTSEQVDNSEEVPVFERLKLYDWTFSGTAEAVVGVLLALLIVACVFA